MHRRQPSLANISRNGHDLFDAAAKGDFKKTKALIEAGANIEFRHFERTPLMIACLTGHLEVVKYLVDKGADINAITTELWSPLFIASYNGHIDIVEYLLSKKAPVEVVDTIGWTPLIAATHNGHLALVNLLLKHKADVFQITNEGLSAHIIARNLEFDDIAEVLLNAENQHRRLFSERNEIDALSSTCSGDYPNANAELVEQRLKLEKREIDLANELTWQGASKGHIQSIYLGIDQGADPLYQGQHPYNCIEAAKLSGNRRCCQFLQAIVLFHTRSVKYWTPDDVLLYLEGTLPLHIASIHMRTNLQEYNAQHPYTYRYIDDLLAAQHQSCGGSLCSVLGQISPNDCNSNQNSPIPPVTIHTSASDHPYIIAYNELLENRRKEHEQRAVELLQNQPVSTTTSQPHPQLPPISSLDKIDPHLLLGSPLGSPTGTNLPTDHTRHMREIVEILDGPINGYVLTSPKFFSILDSFSNLTSEEKRALQSAALCLRHGNPFPHHIKDLFAKYANQYISPEHSLDLTSFNEIQLYLQTFKDIVLGAYNLGSESNSMTNTSPSTNLPLSPSSTHPLIPILILDEPIDPHIFNPHLIDDPLHAAVASPTAGSINGGKGFSATTFSSANHSTVTQQQRSTNANSLLKRDSLEKNQQELAKMALQWWKLIDYDHIQCSNYPNCDRCRLDQHSDPSGSYCYSKSSQLSTTATISHPHFSESLTTTRPTGPITQPSTPHATPTIGHSHHHHHHHHHHATIL